MHDAMRIWVRLGSGSVYCLSYEMEICVLRRQWRRDLWEGMATIQMTTVLDKSVWHGKHRPTSSPWALRFWYAGQVDRHTAVTAYFSSKQLLLFGFAGRKSGADPMIFRNAGFMFS